MMQSCLQTFDSFARLGISKWRSTKRKVSGGRTRRDIAGGDSSW
jgi:hypothetical protein